MNIVFVRKSLIARPQGMKKRAFESCLARLVVKYSAKYFFNLKNTNIIENQKPVFENGEAHFSISHSKDIVGCAIDTRELGFDAEFMKQRDFLQIAAYLKWKAVSKQEFYKAWTAYEAKIKYPCDNVLNFEYDNYMFAVSSDISAEEMKKNLKIYEIKPSKEFELEGQDFNNMFEVQPINVHFIKTGVS